MERQDRCGRARATWRVVVVVVVVLLGGLGLGFAPQPAGAASYTCDEAGLNSAIAAGGSATFGCSAATTVTITGAKTLATNVTLNGGGLLTISGANTYQVFTVNGGVTATLANLTITGGKVSGGGNGGGINNNGTLTVTNCTITGNSTVNGGFGGGINNNGTLTVTDSTIRNNTADQYGGGIFSDGPLIVKSSTIRNNVVSLYQGGGIFVNNGTTAVTNSTLSGNTALSTAPSGGFGGGSFITPTGTLTVTNSTISNNAATTTGGIYNFNGTLNLTNSLVVNNGFPDLGYTSPAVNSHNLTGAFAFADGSAPGNHGGPTATFALPPGSPAIDAGVCLPTYTDPTTGMVVTVTTDGRGMSRPQGAGCDIGAFESTGFRLTRTGDRQSAAVGTAFAQPLAVTITANDAGVPTSGIAVTFSTPTAGASGSFTGTATSVTVNTDANGTATAPAITANTVAGSYTVTATGGGSTATFTATNTAGAAASVNAVSGGGQSAQIGSGFTNPLTVLVKDVHNNPVSGVTVTVTAPTGTNIPTASFAGGAGITSATTDASGLASVTATAAGRPGAVTITASVAGVPTPATFGLTDLANSSTLTLSGFSPPTGPTTGGTLVTITGANLSGATAVSFGGSPASIMTNTATALTVVAPAHAAGTIDISVTTGSGGSAQTATIHGYTYLAGGSIAPAPTSHPLPGSTSGTTPMAQPARRDAPGGTGGTGGTGSAPAPNAVTVPSTPEATPERR